MNAAVTSAPRFSLETLQPFQPTQNYFQLIGWAFVPGSPSPNEVRVVVGDRIFVPLERISRADVAAAYPAEPAASTSGFKFICYLPFGFYEGRLEISADGVTWIPVRALAIPVSSHPILGAIEKPPAGETITRPARIEGWCFHPEFKVREIVLQFGNVEVPCDYGLPRADVTARFPHDPAAARSGFITTENLPRGAGRIKIRATTECGRIYFIRSDHTVKIEEGWIPNPPPPSPVRDLSTLAWAQPTLDRQGTGARPPPGTKNILFALYGDFSANSALHVASLANELIAAGYDCVVAVPDHKETLGALPEARFMALHFNEIAHLPAYFKDGRGPCLVHAWTSRENVRRFATAVAADYGSAVFVHLEDNEQELLESRLGRPFAELAALPEKQLDALVPDVLSHPRHAARFLREAAGVTVIVERLKAHVPAGRPSAVIWPAADPRHFKPLPRDEAFRRALGLAPADIVLFYHGNVHASNAAEVRSLYEAVAQLNASGLVTHLIRTGRDFPDFLPEGDAWIRPHLIHLGHVARAKHLPALMALADYFVQPGVPDAFNDYRFPSKLPEFFAIGRPVILPRTNLGDLVRDGEHALVLAKADGPAIAAAVARLHGDPALAEKLSRGALAFAAEHFSWRRSARQLAEFYRSLTPLAAAASS
ncbi:MAG: putative glycosyl transferase [Verrucomicrobia bacterium]|nr:putative glycosyl transferase [Verrucomicrobiota bacterium]